jgi:hypothetical protein
MQLDGGRGWYRTFCNSTTLACSSARSTAAASVAAAAPASAAAAAEATASAGVAAASVALSEGAALDLRDCGEGARE